jgi:hypothetical protein
MKLMTRISDLLRYFEVDNCFHGDSKIIASCPIHKGDNNTAFNINIDPNDDFYGVWFCNTKHCHEGGNDIIALVSKLLCIKYNKEVSFSEVMYFCEEFVKDVDVNFRGGVTKQDTLSSILESNSKIKVKGKHTREQVRSRLTFPCKYYLDRGYSDDTLDHFDVGLCENPKSEMYNRAVFPVYDEEDKFMVGCVGRTVCGDVRKWINKKGFNKASFLYNYGKALQEISRTSTIILVEGQGDVMRLYEAGIKNAVGIFGSNVSDSQVFLLQKSGAFNIVIMTDNDSAGDACRVNAAEKLQLSFNIYNVITPTGDIGDMSVDQINQIIKPKMKGLF